MFNPFGMNSARQGFGQQGSNQPYDFKGLESRLGKIETGIAGLTEQFGNFQMPGQETVDPAYTGNAAPDPLTTAAPTGGIQSLPGSQASGQALTRTRGPLSLTEKLGNEYRTETGGPLTMGEEWDARAKEMGFDFRKQVRQLEGGEWAGTGQGADHFNQLFEEAGGVLDRPEHGAAARYGEGFTDWLGGQGYQVYTEPQQEWMTQGQQGLGALGQQQDMAWYTPHLSQYAMTGEEMKDPTGTLKTRMANLYQPSGNDVGGLPPGLEGLRGGKLNPNMNITQLPDWQQQQGTLGGFGSRKQPPADLTRALQAGVGSLQGPTQQKIKEGYMT